MSPHRITVHMQIKRNPKSGAVQQWINGTLASEWGDHSTPLPGKEATRRLLQAAMNAVSKGQIHVDLSLDPKGERNA